MCRTARSARCVPAGGRVRPQAARSSTVGHRVPHAAVQPAAAVQQAAKLGHARHLRHWAANGRAAQRAQRARRRGLRDGRHASGDQHRRRSSRRLSRCRRFDRRRPRLCGAQVTPPCPGRAAPLKKRQQLGTRLQAAVMALVCRGWEGGRRGAAVRMVHRAGQWGSSRNAGRPAAGQQPQCRQAGSRAEVQCASQHQPTGSAGCLSPPSTTGLRTLPRALAGFAHTPTSQPSSTH